MRVNFTFCMFVALCSFVAICRGQTYDFSALPACAQDCVNSTFANTTCRPLSPSGGSCACNERPTLRLSRDCFATACARKNELTALNITFAACIDEPVRDKSVSYRNIILAFYILALVSLAAHWTVRFTVGRLQWLNDGVMVAVLATNTLLFATCYKMSFTGLGLDMWNIPFPSITKTLLYFWISEVSYFFALGFIKISFLLFFLQIFPEKRFRTIVWVFVYFQVASMTAFGTAATFLCRPIKYAWLQWDDQHSGTCINNNALAFSHAAHSIIIDFITISLPITQIWKLHLGLKKKIGVLLMFGVGAFVTVVSMIRLRALVNFAKSTDMTWDYLEASLWSVIECQVGIICTCMPSIRLGLTRLFPKMLGSTNQSTAKDTAARSGRSHGQSNRCPFTANEINVQTTFRVSHTKKPQTADDQRSFVQLVEIDADSKSAGSAAGS